jgi:hypothetical protein
MAIGVERRRYFALDRERLLFVMISARNAADRIGSYQFAAAHVFGVVLFLMGVRRVVIVYFKHGRAN